MASPIQAAGGTVEPSEYAPLTMDRYITGLVTQRSPLRDAAVPYLQEKFYSAGRTDSLWDGLNVELSADLTLIRRPGLSVYNSQSFPPITRFYDFRLVVDGLSQVRVIADTASGVYDATGPNTKTLLWTKGSGANPKTCFQSVGNTLYFSTGTEQKKWMVGPKAWAAKKTFNAGEWIVDTHNNVQQIVAQQMASIASVTILSNVLTVQFLGPSPFKSGQQIQLSALGQAGFLNGVTVTLASTSYVNGIQVPFEHADYAQTSDTGRATSGAANGISGVSAPPWQTAIGAYTGDGNLLWRCWGSSVQNWGIVAPPIPPNVTQAKLPQNYPSWTAGTSYSTSLALIDSNNNIQKLQKSGTTGTSQPVWAVQEGITTADGTAVWVCNGTVNRNNGVVYVLGDIVLASYTYYVEVFQPTQDPQEYDGGNIARQQNTGYYTEQAVEVVELFRCTVAGTSGTSVPDWSSAPGVGSTVSDGTLTWTNIGPEVTWASFGASASLSLSQTIVDANGFLQNLATSGKAGTTVPAWGQIQSATTVDGTVTWTNAGPYSAANTGAWQWVAAYKNSIDGSVSSASSKSITVTVGQGNMAVLQGRNSADPQVDTIVLFRTNVSGNLLLYEDEFPQPTGSTWTYFDTIPDADLVAELLAPLSGVNNPPPAGITALAFHLNRVWAAVGNLVYFCTGPDTTIGNGFTSWSVSNQFGYPDAIARLVPVTLSNGALLCFTASDVQAVFGLGTSSSPFYPTVYVAGVGLLGGDALDIVGSSIHMFTTAQKQISLDPSAGYIETGFPIGDQFEAVTTGGINPTALYNAPNVYVTWHEAGTGDTGLFVADGGVGWFRYSPVSAPESGFLWSPRAAIEGGTSAVKSVEIYPGVKALLVGPSVVGPILRRDSTLRSDSGTAYTDTYAIIGSMQLAQSGQLAEVAHIALDSKRVGTAPTVGLLFGEIAETANVGFDMLERTDCDPPNLPASETLFNDRFSCLQNEVAPLCRHLQMLLQWSVEDAPSELLQHTVYGAVHSERKQQ